MDSRSASTGDNKIEGGLALATPVLYQPILGTSNEDIDGSSATASLTVQTSEPMGSESLVYFKAGQGSFIARIQGDHIFHLGENVAVRLDLEKGTFFDPATEKVIG